MGFLDDLKRQAEALKTQQMVDTAALARNAASVETACQAAWRYWMDLAPQLNVLLPRPPVRFMFDKSTTIDGFTRCDFRVDARRKPHRGQEVFDHVVIHALQKSGRAVTISKDFPPEIERLEGRLRQAGIAPDSKWVRDPVSGRLEEVRFSFVADIAMTVRLLPDHDQGRVSFQLGNLDDLGTVVVTFEAGRVDSNLLDQLARWMVGEPHEFLKLAESARRQDS